ncbi:MAG: hypothetical protein AB8B49_11240 [Nitratireductor sp.]
MSKFKNVIFAVLGLATLVFVVPFFAMLGLALVGFTLFAGLLGSLAMSYKAKQQNKSRFAKAYAENEYI